MIEMKLEKKEATRQKEDSSLLLDPTCGCHSWENLHSLYLLFPPKKYIANLVPCKIVDFSPFSPLEEKLRSGCLAAAVGSDKHAGWHFCACEIPYPPCKQQSGGCSGHRKGGGTKDLAGRAGIEWGPQRVLWKEGPHMQLCLPLCPSFPPSPGDIARGVPGGKGCLPCTPEKCILLVLWDPPLCL